MNRIEELEDELKKEKAKQLFIKFCSPGTFFSETSMVPTDNNLPNLREAIRKFKNIKERYNAKPYGFCYVDGNGKDYDELFYYINGNILRYDDIPENDENHILRSNMLINNEPIIIQNNNSWKFRSFFRDTDILIDEKCNILAAGDDKDLIEYRKEFAKNKKAGKYD